MQLADGAADGLISLWLTGDGWLGMKVVEGGEKDLMLQRQLKEKAPIEVKINGRRRRFMVFSRYQDCQDVAVIQYQCAKLIANRRRS